MHPLRGRRYLLPISARSETLQFVGCTAETRRGCAHTNLLVAAEMTHRHVCNRKLGRLDEIHHLEADMFASMGPVTLLV